MNCVPHTTECLILDDDELKAGPNQSTLEWRKAPVINIQTLFQTPKDKPEFPKAFQTYRSKQYETLYPLLPAKVGTTVTTLSISTCMIDSDDDYPYAPSTP